jgi:hypothetical protein
MKYTDWMLAAAVALPALTVLVWAYLMRREIKDDNERRKFKQH